LDSGPRRARRPSRATSGRRSARGSAANGETASRGSVIPKKSPVAKAEQILEALVASGALHRVEPAKGKAIRYETITLLDEKAFSPVMEEMANIKTDAALAPLIRTRYQELATTYQTMKDLYSATNKPADKYTSAVQSVRAKHLHLVGMLQKDLKVDVPAPIMAMMKTKVPDAQPALVITQIVPGSVQSRVIRGRQTPRGAIGSRKTDTPTARDRMQERLNSRGR